VAWVRLLGLAFGVTVYAISTVLAAFMAGLAIGSLVGGQRADSTRRPLRVYGLVELGVGATALLTPWAFSWLQDVYAVLAQAPAIAAATRTVLAFAVLVVPTALMGATLPLAVRAAHTAVARTPDTARAIGLLYGINTGGAIAGCLLSGFVLIGRLGLNETIAAAASCNLIAGIGGLLLGRKQHATHEVTRRAQAEQTSARVAKAALWVFAISGGISLAYEVVWSRILAILFDSSIYGFVLMLATVLLGIAVGGALGGLVMGWRPAPRVAAVGLAALEIGIGLAAVLALLAFGGAYDLLVGLRDTPLARLVRTDTRLMAALCVVTVLPAALLMGATFPAAARLWAAGSSKLGRRLGGIYGANVAGAILGSLAGGFLLVPLLGAHTSLLLLACANVLLSLPILWALRSRLWLLPLAALPVIAWGASRPPLHNVVFAQHFPDQQLVAYWEGLENTVSVGRAEDGVQTLFTNSRGQTNDAPDLVRYHRVMGHLAALLAPSSSPRALVVGLGAGATPGAIAQHGGSHVDVIELSEAVIAAAPYFRAANLDVISQSNVHLAVDDGRNFLLRNRVPYDIVTADVIHPYDAGSTNLYSVEYFRLVAKSLRPDGIMVQWVSPGSAFEHALIVRTFLEAFPYASLWLSGDLLVGSSQPLKLSRSTLESRLADASARAALAEVGFNHAQDVLAQFRADDAELRAYAAEGPVLTDNHPLLEYFLAQDIGSDAPDLSRFRGTPSIDN
jgi:spermidine synthase